MRVLSAFLAVLLSINYVYCAMTEAQLKSAMKLIRNVCQPKSKATDEQIDGMHKGNWDLDKAGQCYVWCLLNMYKLITKDNRFDWESGINTLNVQAPESIRSFAIKTVEKCKDAVKTTNDKCAAGYEIGKCIYEADPVHYFLP